MSNIFPLDIAAVKVHGIERWQEDFFWPVSDVEFFSLWEDVERVFTRAVEAAEPMLGDALIAKHLLTFEYAYLLHAMWTVQRLQAAGYTPRVSRGAFWYEAILADQFEGPLRRVTPFHTMMKEQTRTPHATWGGPLGKAKRFVRELQVNGGRKVLGRLRTRRRGATYGFPHALVRGAMNRSPLFTTLITEHDWLHGQQAAGHCSACAREAKEAGENILRQLLDMCGARQIVLSPGAQDYLRRFTQAHLEDALWALLILGRAPLPEHFFAYSAGHAFQRTFALAVRRAGGKVTTCTHGGHIGHLNSPTMPTSEFALSDEFVCYTKGNIPLFERIREERPALRGNRVAFTSADTSMYQTLRKSAQAIPAPEVVKRVLVCGFPLDIWRKPSGSGLHAPTRLDFEWRYISFLKEKGYEVLYKVHPDRKEEARGIFEPIAEVVYDGDISQMMDSYDAMIFTSPRSTAMMKALCTNKPVISFLMDQEYPRPFEEPMSLLEKRCAIIRTRLDERQRIQFSEEKLLEALAQTPTMPNQEFVERYLLP